MLLDTFDGRLEGSRYTLAAQPEGDGTLLKLAGTDASRERRVLVGAPPAFVSDLPPALADLLAPILEDRRLFTVAEVESRARRLTLLDRRRAPLAHLLVLESVSRKLPIPGFPSPADGQAVLLPALLAVTPAAGRERATAPLIRGLVEGRQLLPTEHSPRAVWRLAFCAAARAGRPAGASTPSAELHHDLAAAEAMRRVHRVLLAAIRLNERGVRLDLDVEFLHELRVAVRRTRSLLGQVKRVFQSAHVEHWREELSWLGRLTGPVRDLDVFLGRLADPLLVPPEEAAALAPLIDRLRQRRQAELGRLLAQLDTLRFTTLLAGWEDFLTRDDPATGRGKPAHRAEAPIAFVAGRRIDRLHARFVKRGRALRADSPPEDLHALRIEAKKLRYVLDSTKAVFDPVTVFALLPPLKLVQAALGDAQDCHVQRELVQHTALELAAAGMISTETLTLVARLDARLAAMAESARIRFAQHLPALLADGLRAAVREIWRAPAAPATKHGQAVSDPMLPVDRSASAAARVAGQ